MSHSRPNIFFVVTDDPGSIWACTFTGQKTGLLAGMLR